MDIQAQKKALRTQLRRQAGQLPGEYLAASDEAIARRLLALPQWQQAKTVFLYLSMGTEPHTHGLLDHALAQGKRVGVPRCLGGSVMEARQVTGLRGLVPKVFGILEPDETAPLLEPREFDLVVAPCVAADEQCHRLGNGAGYYDQYLTRVDCPVVCLCRGRLVQKRVPVQAFDIPVDMVLTEDGLIERRGQ